MAEKISKKLLAVACITALVGGAVGGFVAPSPQPTIEIPQSAIDSAANKAVANFADNLNIQVVSDVNASKVDKLYQDYFEEDFFKSEAEVLAQDEFELKSYKAVYEALDNLYGDIDEKSDISKVVVKESDVTSVDVDEKDATVVQELKVYYEDLNGDTVKRYLKVTTSIVDGEVEDQEFEEL